MIEIDNFLNFILEHKEDEKIDIIKKKKFGYRLFTVTLSIDSEEIIRNSHVFTDALEIIVDERNKCFEILYNHGSDNFIVENEELVAKWSNKLDQILNENISTKILDVFEKSLNACNNKNLHREYQMRKIFPNLK